MDELPFSPSTEKPSPFLRWTSLTMSGLKLLLILAITFLASWWWVEQILLSTTVFWYCLNGILLSITFEAGLTALYAFYWSETGQLSDLRQKILKSADPITGKLAIQLFLWMVPSLLVCVVTMIIQAMSIKNDVMDWLNDGVSVILSYLVGEWARSLVYPQCTLIYTWLMLQLLAKWKQFNETLAGAKDSLEHTMERYTKLSRVTEQMDDLLSTWMALMLIVTVSALSAEFFVLGMDIRYENALLRDSRSITVASTVGGLVMFFSIYWVAALIYDEHVFFLESLRSLTDAQKKLKIKDDKYRPDYLELLYFIQSASQEPKGLTIGRYVTITRSVVLNYLGMMITYVMLFIQFQQSDTSTAGTNVLTNNTTAG